MAQGSYFKGWASNLPYIPTPGSNNDSSEVFTGHVLNVDYTGEDAGKIRVKLIGIDKHANDDDVKLEAYPADLCMVKYPLPGELVKIFPGFISKTRKGKFAIAYYYTTVLSSNSSITYNGDPFVGQAVPANKASEIYTPEYKNRFHSKIKNFKTYFISDDTGDYVIDRGPLNPSEGEVVVQGRFGSSIRFSAADTPDLLTSLENGTREWSEKGGTAGDPVLVMNVNGTTSPVPVTEDVNGDGSKVYLSSYPTVPVVLATSKLKSNMFVYNLSDTGISTTDDQTKFMESKPIPPQMMLPLGTGIINLSGSNFSNLVEVVIDNFEGGYWSDKWFENPTLGKSMGWPYDSRYSTSGETMFGIDRRNGGSLNTSVAGVSFWQLIDSQNASNTWRWGYMGGASGPQLKQLVGAMMEPVYTKLASQYLTQQTINAVSADPRLTIHMVYAVWNGPGWFKKFGQDLNNAIARGITQPNELAAVALGSRTNEGLKPGSSPNSLIYQGGRKMTTLFTKIV